MDKRYGILIVSVTILVLYFAGTASAGTWYVDDDGGADFTGIQEAINNASDGDTILVSSGVYYENVIVDKSVTLIGNGQPVVDAGGEGSAITLTADGITLVGFNATNAGSSGRDVGIKVTSNNNTITGNNVSNNNDDGIYLYLSNNNTITGNNVSNNNYVGIYLYLSSNNTITGNNVSNNYGAGGIGRHYSSDNSGVGIYLKYSWNNTITDNNVSNNYWYGIHLDDSSKNTITGNNVSNNDWNGIYLDYFSNNNTITGNNVSNNRDGIELFFHNNNNTITGNNVSNNNEEGISLCSSSNNKIYFNNFINNTDNVYSYDASTNIWNSPEEITYTYDGNAYKSYLGNYWDDYEGTDADKDGIGDEPYSINGDRDNYPLMEPWENYIDTAHGPTKILFSDDFSDDGSGWSTYEGYDGRVIYKDGCLYIKDYTNPDNTMYSEFQQRYFSDFIIEVETRLVGGSDDNWHSVSCRYKDMVNSYDFDISADGYYEILKWVDGNLIELVKPTYSSYIHQGRDVSNLIHVECIGSDLSLSVNGHLLAEVTDATFTGGGITLSANSLAGTFTEVAFDNLVVTEP